MILQQKIVILKKEVSVTLTEASSDINSIRAKFQVIDTMDAIKGNLVLTVVNTDTGKTVYTKILANTPEEQLVVINTLSSDSNYVMTVENNEVSTQYFQKSFRTESLNLKLRRELVTESSLAYSVDFGTNMDIVSADVTLKDGENNEIYRHTVYNGEENFVSFEGLTNNTLYNVTVDNVVIGNVLYPDLYTSNTSDLTLKFKPTLGSIFVKTNDDAKTFTLSMSDVIDDDLAIVKYTYEIYAAADLTEENISTAKPVYSFSRNDLENQILTLDEAKGLYGNKDYAFKIVAQYYDNYRYNEVSTMMSDYFQIVGKPTISWKPTEVGINSIAGIVTIEDADCTIPYAGRERFDKENKFSILYKAPNDLAYSPIEDVKFNSKTMTLEFNVDGLTEDTLYSFVVLADADFNFGRFTGPNGYMILCPYHSEKTPSFRVKDYENIFNCFGCGSSGNVYDYLKLTHNMEFLEAIDFLMKVYMWKKEDADEKNHDLIIKYQKAIISPEFSELLKRCQERMQRKDLDFMPHSSTLTKDFFNDRFLMIERMKKGLADPDYIERDPAVNIKFTSKEVWAATDSTEIKELRRKRILAMDPEEFRKELNRNLKSNPEEDDESLLPF